MQDFRKLLVWRSAHELAVMAIRHSARLPRGNAELISQLRRSTASIGANIAEGAQRNTPAQFAHFLGIALASLAESHNHLLLLRDARLMPREQSDEMLAIVDRLRPMLLNLQLRVRAAAVDNIRQRGPHKHPEPPTPDPQP